MYGAHSRFATLKRQNVVNPLKSGGLAVWAGDWSIRAVIVVPAWLWALALGFLITVHQRIPAEERFMLEVVLDGQAFRDLVAGREVIAGAGRVSLRIRLADMSFDLMRAAIDDAEVAGAGADG